MNVLVVAPHPDDESIGCGGTLAAHVARGDRVAVVFLTSGELGIKLPPQEVWRIREGEAQEAAKVLGISAVSFLRYPDWFLGEHAGAASDTLRSILHAEQPQLIYAPHALEWHPDHKAAWSVVISALDGVDLERPEIRAYEVWT